MCIPTEQRGLFDIHLRVGARRAEDLLRSPDDHARVRAISDDGFSAIERLEHSPLADDQFTAIALRLAVAQPPAEPIADAIERHFRNPPSALALDAHRRAVWRGVESMGLPVERATRAVDRLAARLAERPAGGGVEIAASVRDHAGFYAWLWPDPRLRAGIAARRVMMAMVDLLETHEEGPRRARARS
ncbi:hypothetical protein [Sphingomonas colocasiae]|uniref:Uncharacterized protein n=1 Tax=Sphingomonas colocasiae TaxID=1848973 RepID=A0ABS7PKN3_9SPHN|nr:hypothetical protein [Sphingomonas colocasiae]MBY8821859.1 hypothetical protein [Sphingomonas colocasiae]